MFLEVSEVYRVPKKQLKKKIIKLIKLKSKLRNVIYTFFTTKGAYGILFVLQVYLMTLMLKSDK